MPHFSGKALYMEMDSVDISADHRGLEVSEAVSTANTTAGADVAESHIVLTSSATFDLTILDEDGTAGDAIRAALVKGKQGVFTFGPQGNATGKPMYSCNVTVTNVSRSFPYDNAVEYKATLTRNGDWIANYDADPLDVFPV